MKAIVSTIEKAGGRISVKMLGYGQTEREARIAAFACVHHGHNDFDDEYQGGQLVDVARDLTEILRADLLDQTWDNVYDQDGGLVESHANEGHFRCLRATSNLYLRGKTLHARA